MRRLRERVLERYPDARHEKLRQHVQLWMGQLAVGLGVDPALVETMWRLEEGEMLIPAAVDRLRRERAKGRREADMRVAAAEDRLRRERAAGRREGRKEGRAEGRAQFRAEIAEVIRNGGTAAEALARVEEIVNGNGESSSGS